MRLRQSDIDSIIKLSPFITDAFGISIGIIENLTIIWYNKSPDFYIEVFEIGQTLSSEGAVARTVKEGTKVDYTLPFSLYNASVKIISYPIYCDNSEEVYGAIAFVIPQTHPIVEAFDKFAPAISEMFPGGAIVYLTDLDKVTHYQKSPNWDFQKCHVGTTLGEDSNAKQVIKEQKICRRESVLDKIPCAEINYPLFDNENSIVGTMGMLIPKTNARKVQEASESLVSSMTQISTAAEHLALSATDITTLQSDLNKNIENVSKFSNDISTIVEFTQEIADETRMLGLNAAIEAARAGEYGRGFGVVADEIRKLSAQSKETAGNIKNLLQEIKNAVEKAVTNSIGTLKSAEEQAAGVEEISASIQELNSFSSQLADIAAEL